MGPLPRPFELVTISLFARDNIPRHLVLDDFCRMHVDKRFTGHNRVWWFDPDVFSDEVPKKVPRNGPQGRAAGDGLALRLC